MRPWPTPKAKSSSNNSGQANWPVRQQKQQSVFSSSEYIGPADIASPTLPPTQHGHELANGSITLIGQSAQPTATNEFNAVSEQGKADDYNYQPVSIAVANSVEKLSTTVQDGVITTPSGLKAIVPQYSVTTVDNMIPSKTSPGYFEHPIN